MLTLFAFRPLARMSIRLKHCSGIGVADIVLARYGGAHAIGRVRNIRTMPGQNLFSVALGVK